MSVDLCPRRWLCGHHVVITLPAEIDLQDAEKVAADLARALDERPAGLIVDMTATVYCGAAGLRALAGARHRAAAEGTELRVAASVGLVRRVLELTGMDELVDVYPDLNPALNGLHDRVR